MSNILNCYEIMKITNFSSFDEIKAKYKDLMIKHHPDKGGDAATFNNYKQAYDYLKENKDDHDRKLKCKIRYLSEIILNFLRKQMIVSI